jgi:hypothetical protein
MTKSWAIVGAVMVGASLAGAQERAPTGSEAGAKVVAVEVSQVPVAAKVRVPLETKVVAGAPYSAEVVTESIEALADGNRIVHRTTARVYRDGAGRVRREEDRGPGQAPSVFITDPVAGVSYSLDPDNKVAVKTQGGTGATVPHVTDERGTLILKSEVDPGDLERKRHIEEAIVTSAPADLAHVVVLGTEPSVKIAKVAPAWEAKVEKLPAKQVEGLSAEGTRTTRTIPAGAIGNERPIV